MRVRPIQLAFSNYRQIEGYWNPLLVRNGLTYNCFMLEMRLSSSTPMLRMDDLGLDPQLQRYISANKAKAEDWAQRGV